MDRVTGEVSTRLVQSESQVKKHVDVTLTDKKTGEEKTVEVTPEMIEYKDRAVRFGAMGMVGGLATLGLESFSQAMWDASVLDQTAAATTEAAGEVAAEVAAEAVSEAIINQGLIENLAMATLAVCILSFFCMTVWCFRFCTASKDSMRIN